MDPLSVTASIIAVVQLSSEVIKYLNNVKSSPKECQQCTIEASTLQNLFINLRYRLEEGQGGDPWFMEVQKLNIPDGTLSQYKPTLEELRSRLEAEDGLQRVKRRLLWRFSKEEVTSILARMERLKSLVSVALENDHL